MNTVDNTLTVAGLDVDVIRKDIKHIHISVYPPNGRVRVAAPHRIGDEAVRLAIVQRLPWIRKQQDRLRNAPRQSERRMVSGETHYVWGERYRLDVSRTGRHGVEFQGKTLWLVAPTGSDVNARRRVLDRWYRRQLADALPPLLEKWQDVVGQRVDKIVIRRMKTKWGSCTPQSRSIRINVELATRNPRCLEYVVVHELAHLIERSHNDRFVSLMDHFLPAWRAVRDELNQSPLSYAVWGSPPDC
jgi:predicted metal-dependent hydrolase